MAFGSPAGEEDISKDRRIGRRNEGDQEDEVDRFEEGEAHIMVTIFNNLHL